MLCYLDKPSLLDFPVRLIICLLTVMCLFSSSATVQAEEEPSRFCVGFLYCKETKGDTTTTEALIYLYSTEERGTFSRLTVIPFYSREMDPAQNYLRRSILWPLGISERKGDAYYFQILPFYWQAEEETSRYQIVVPLYFDYSSEDKRYNHLIPFYGHHQEKLRHRYFILGPVAIATYDKETDLKEWDILMPMFHYGGDRNGYETRLFPMYWSGGSYNEGSWYRHLAPLYWSGANQLEGTEYRHLLPLYGRSVTSRSDLMYLFPLYGSVTDFPEKTSRTSAVGLPPIPQSQLPSLALYEHASSPTSVSDRLFPLYRYAHDEAADLADLNIIGLFQLDKSPTLTAHRLFPLYMYESDRQADETGWSGLGYGRFSLVGFGSDPRQRWHHFIPLYHTSEDLTAGTLTTDAVGLGPLSFFRYSRTPDGWSHRFFPLYRYEHPSADEWHWSALFAAPLALYRHDEKGTAVHDRFIPLYAWDRNGDWREFSMLGISWFSMFYRESGPTRVTNRLFPLYRYHHDLAADEVKMDTLLLHRHHTTPARGDDRFLFLWDATWQRDEPMWELYLIGFKPVTLFHHEAAQAGTADRLFPIFGYRSSSEGERRLSLIGFPPRETGFAWSLYEQRSAPNGFLTRLFPLYRFERDDAAKEVNWSALLLYQHRQSKSHLVDKLPPLHEFERDDEKGTTELNLIGLKPLTLFKQGFGTDSANSMLFPLYDYDRAGDSNRLSAIGLPKVGSLPTLSLFEREGTPSLTTHRFFPLYAYAQDRVAHTRSWEGLLLWWHREKESHLRDFFLPLTDLERDDGDDSYRLSLLGLPKMGSFPPLTLFSYEREQSQLTHRMFPIYRYNRNDEAKTLNWDALLWWHRETEYWSQNVFYPFADLEYDRQKDQRDVGLFGMRPLTFFQYRSSPTEYWHYAALFYAYLTDVDQQRLSILGLPHYRQFPALSLFAMERTPSSLTHRFFPLYWYAWDDPSETLDWEALLLWWHHERKGYLRNLFLPLSDVERDNANESRRVSLIGLPKVGTLPPLTLFNWEQTATTTAHRMVPLYSYAKDDAARTVDWGALLLWWHRERDLHLRDIFLPLSDVERDQATGSTRLSFIGFPKYGTLPPLTLVSWEQTPTATSHRVLPLYSYAKDDGTHEVDWQALLLWWHREQDTHLRDFFLPLTDVERDSATESRRVSLIGLPKFGTLPPLTLFNWERTPTTSSHRMLPLYDYAKDDQAQTLDWQALLLWWHRGSPKETSDMLLPLGSWRRNSAEEAWNFSALGVEPVSLVEIDETPTSRKNRFSPLWDYGAEEGRRRISFAGIRQAALFSYEQTPDGSMSHLFPLWWQHDAPDTSWSVLLPFWSDFQDRQAQDRQFGALGIGPFSLYFQHRTPNEMTARIFPFWNYEFNEQTEESETGLFGVAPLSLYYHYSSPTAAESRLFPFYRYTSDRAKDESEFWFLWPLYDQKTAQGRTTEASSFWWLFEYRSPQPDEWEYWVLGHPPMALFIRTVSPTVTHVEVNPILPGYKRETVEGVGTSWEILGGFVGMRAMPDGTHKLRLLWGLEF